MSGTLDSMFVDLRDQSAASEVMIELAKSLSQGDLPESVRSNETIRHIMEAGLHKLDKKDNPWDKLRKMG